MKKKRLRRYLLFAPILLGVALILDSLSTYLFLVSGSAIEGNPLVSLLFNARYGFIVFLVFKLLGVILAFYIAYYIRAYALWRQLLYALLVTVIAALFLVASLSNLAFVFYGHGLFNL
jgi:hypothetical protein